MRRFKFENSWLLEPDLDAVVNNSWSKGGNIDVVSKIEMCTDDLSLCGRNLRSQFKKDINMCKMRLEVLRGMGDDAFVSEFNATRDHLSSLLVQEEKFWKQRSKVHWLRDGDQNTRRFHAMASSRKKKNTILSLTDPSGNTFSEHEDFCRIARLYFEDIITARSSDPSIVSSLISPRINAEDNTSLLAPFKIKEFQSALMSMNSDFAPGPDGINPAFYKRLWDLAGMDIFKACCSWLDNGMLPLLLMILL